MSIEELNKLVVILLFGSLILLSVLKFTNPLGLNKKANLWMGMFLLLWSSYWMEEIALLTKNSEPEFYVSFIVHYIQFFTPVCFYISVLYFTNPKFRFSKINLVWLILPFLFLINHIILNFGSEANKSLFEATYLIIILIQLLIYSIASYLKIRKYQKKIQFIYSNTKDLNLNWLEYIITVILIVSLMTATYNVFYGGSLNIILNTTFLLSILAIAHYSMRQKETYPLDDLLFEELINSSSVKESQLERKKLVSDEDLIDLKRKISKLMKDKKPYLNSEITLIKISEMLDITPHQLSYVLNTGFNENFFQFINKYRIEKTKELLMQDEMNKLSILGIAYESGFNSKTSFYTVFKKITGLTPSEYKKKSSSL